eukprot:8488843-Pyramimonas_sp.AAC.1
MRPAPRAVSSRFGAESDLELELTGRPTRPDCNQLWASYALKQPELEIQIGSVRIRMPRAT